MAENHYVIGVDGGGTSTVARLADLEGNIISVVKGGPSNVQISGAEKSAEILSNLINDVVSSTPVMLDSVQIVVYGTAGAGRKADQDRLHNAITSHWGTMKRKPRSLIVVSDADIALEAAHGGGSGIVLIAGTGSIVYGRDVDNTIKRYGGWGPVIGDPGSGTAIGLRALRVAAKTIDECTQPAYLERLIAETAGIDSQESLINKVYTEKFPPADIAPLVFRAAKEGDRSALDIVNECANDLAEMLHSGIKKFSFTGEIPLAYVGGIFESENGYAEIVTEFIRKKNPNIVIRKPECRAGEGAVLMALRFLQESE